MKQRYYHYRTLFFMISLTIVLFIGFDAVARSVAHAMIEEQFMNQARHQSNVIAELVRDMESGYAQVDSYETFGRGKALRAHVKLVEAMIDRMRASDGLYEYAGEDLELTSNQQAEILAQIDEYRTFLEGTIAIYSTDQGMLLYPEGKEGHLNIYFNAANRMLMDNVVERGERFGEIEYSSIIQGDIDLSGFFSYDPVWKWLIFAVDENANKSSSRRWIEELTVMGGIRHAKTFRGISDVYVTDGQFEVEYEIYPRRRGQRIDTIDLMTNRNVTELMDEAMGAFVEYTSINPLTGRAQLNLVQASRVEAGNHIVVVEVDLDSVSEVEGNIVLRIRILMAGAAAALLVILFILYQNFVVLIDPLAEQEVAQT